MKKGWIHKALEKSCNIPCTKQEFCVDNGFLVLLSNSVISSYDKFLLQFFSQQIFIETTI